MTADIQTVSSPDAVLVDEEGLTYMEIAGDYEPGTIVGRNKETVSVDETTKEKTVSVPEYEAINTTEALKACHQCGIALTRGKHDTQGITRLAIAGKIRRSSVKWPKGASVPESFSKRFQFA